LGGGREIDIYSGAIRFFLLLGPPPGSGAKPEFILRRGGKKKDFFENLSRKAQGGGDDLSLLTVWSTEEKNLRLGGDLFPAYLFKGLFSVLENLSFEKDFVKRFVFTALKQRGSFQGGKTQPGRWGKILPPALESSKAHLYAFSRSNMPFWVPDRTLDSQTEEKETPGRGTGEHR